MLSYLLLSNAPIQGDNASLRSHKTLGKNLSARCTIAPFEVFCLFSSKSVQWPQSNKRNYHCFWLPINQAKLDGNTLLLKTPHRVSHRIWRIQAGSGIFLPSRELSYLWQVLWRLPQEQSSAVLPSCE